MTANPVRRRLDLRTFTPGGGGAPFLLANLVDDSQGDHVIANGECALPDQGQSLGNTGLTVADFLDQFRRGERGLVEPARHYGRLLYDGLLRLAPDLRDPWAEALRQALGCGLRLEIRLPAGDGARLPGQPVSTLPFELMCDDNGFLFRRPGWATVRRLRDSLPRALRLSAEVGQKPVLLVGWANVLHDGISSLPEADFVAHEQAAADLAASGHVISAPPLRHATRQHLAQALQQHRPHVLVWIGHGVSSGSALVLHDDQQPGYPQDLGTPVSAADFASDARAGEVDMALLWSCHGAGTERALDVGVAEALLRPEQGNLAAVVASFSALEPAAVARFSKAVLTAWAHHPEGDLEASLARARSALDEQSLTWARPVLFLRTPPADRGLRLGPLPVPRPEAAPLSAELRRLPPLPARSPSYVDHQQRVQQLAQDLQQHAIVVLEGLPGVGKTKLALAIAHRQRQAGVDVAFVDVTGQQDIGNLMAQLFQLVSDAPLEQAAALFSAMADLRWLLVIDNAEDLLRTPPMRADLQRLLRGLAAASSGFACLVTSRRALAAPAETWLCSREQQPLNTAESLRLFVALAGRRLPADQAASPALPLLLADLGGLPRAIALMAGQLGGDVDVPRLRQRLRDLGPQAIVAADLFGEPISTRLDARLRQESLVSALNLSLQSVAQQDPQAETLFDALGAFPAGLSQALLPSAQFPWLADTLAVLLDHHLVNLVGEERRIAISAPVRAYAWARLDKQGLAACVPDGLLWAMLARLTAWLDAAAGRLGTAHGGRARIDILVEEPNLLQALAVLLRPGQADASADLVGSIVQDLGEALSHGGRAQAGLPAIESVVDRLRQRWPVSRALATALCSLGGLKVRTADLAGARQAYEQALPIYREIDNRLGEANTLQSLGRWHLASGDPQSAFMALHAALQLQQAIADELGAAGSQVCLARIAAQAGQPLQAAGLVAAALATLEAIDHQFGQGIAYLDLGQALLGSYPAEGLACLLRAEDLARQINDPVADKIRDLVHGMRADHLSAEAFARELAATRDGAQALIEGLFSQVRAAVEAGELDLYAAPGADDGR